LRVKQDVHETNAATQTPTCAMYDSDGENPIDESAARRMVPVFTVLAPASHLNELTTSLSWPSLVLQQAAPHVNTDMYRMD
jgi:hypothetical protein